MMRKFFCVLFVSCGVAVPSPADNVIFPSADGTLVDGGGYGIFDGIADSADWSFNQSSYEGAVTFSRKVGAEIEHRLVFEFNLSAVSRPLPVVAGLRFKLRGAPIFPADAAQVQVISFPSDLLENTADFSAGPATVAGVITVAPFQPTTLYEIDVSDQVNAALRTNIKRLAFRLQLFSQTQSAQAFMDALDTDTASKPSLVVYDAGRGDFDHDGGLDVNDLNILIECVTGPNLEFPPGCSPCDLDGDLDVDLKDVRTFEELRSSPSD